MSTLAELAVARERYRDHVLAHWRALERGDSAQADARSAQADAIIAAHEADVSPLLNPLAEDLCAEVRCAAAGALLQRGDTTAVPVLERIEHDTSAGPVATSAERILRTWRHRTGRS